MRIPALALALLLLGCGVAAPPSPTGSPLQAIETTSSPPSAGFCDQVDLGDITNAMGQNVNVIDEASSTEICALRVGAGEAGYDVNIRIEDAFGSLESVESTLTEGEATEVAGYQGYWVSTLQVLWLEVADDLYAVQLIGDDLDAEPFDLARALADVAIIPLAP